MQSPALPLFSSVEIAELLFPVIMGAFHGLIGGGGGFIN